MKYVYVFYFCVEDLVNGLSGVFVVWWDFVRFFIYGIYGKLSW